MLRRSVTKTSGSRLHLRTWACWDTLSVCFQKCVPVLFYTTLWMCINYRYFLKCQSWQHFRFKHSNRTKRQFPSEKRIATKDSNLQLSRQWYLFNRGHGTSNRGMTPDPMLSSIHLSEPSWEWKTSLLHNPHATIFCQCWKLEFQCDRIKMTNYKPWFSNTGGL